MLFLNVCNNSIICRNRYFIYRSTYNCPPSDEESTTTAPIDLETEACVQEIVDMEATVVTPMDEMVAHEVQAAKLLKSKQQKASATPSTSKNGPSRCHQYYYCPGSLMWSLSSQINWSIQNLISGGGSRCSSVYCSCTGPQFGQR